MGTTENYVPEENLAKGRVTNLQDPELKVVHPIDILTRKSGAGYEATIAWPGIDDVCRKLNMEGVPLGQGRTQREAEEQLSRDICALYQRILSAMINGLPPPRDCEEVGPRDYDFRLLPEREARTQIEGWKAKLMTSIAPRRTPAKLHEYQSVARPVHT